MSVRDFEAVSEFFIDLVEFSINSLKMGVLQRVVLSPSPLKVNEDVYLQLANFCSQNFPE